MTVTLEDGRKVLVRPSKKKFYEKFVEFGSDPKNKTFGGLLEMSAMILSDNPSGVTFTPEELEEMFDIGDVKLLINEYQKFLKELGNNPN